MEFKKSNLLNLFPNSLFLDFETVKLTFENNLSEGTDVPMMDKYFRASTYKSGYTVFISSQH